MVDCSELDDNFDIDFVKIHEELIYAFDLVGFVIKTEYIELIQEIFENNVKFVCDAGDTFSIFLIGREIWQYLSGMQKTNP